MKILISLMMLAVMFIATGAYAASDTSVVKERAAVENSMSKDSPSADEDDASPASIDKEEERTRMEND